MSPSAIRVDGGRGGGILTAVWAVLVVVGPAPARMTSMPPITDRERLDAPSNGCTTYGSRLFAIFPEFGGGEGVQIAELVDGSWTAFPDETTQAWSDGRDATEVFVRANSLRVGPDGYLWVVDTGAPWGRDPVPGGQKLVRVDVDGRRFDRVYTLDGALTPSSSIDDVRFHGSLAYLSDAGDPGLIVLDLVSGAARRVLHHDPSTTASRPITAEHQTLRTPDGTDVVIHCDQLEVSPDGATLYFQPCCGPMSAVPTRLLDDPDATDAEVAAAVRPFAATGSTGGTAIDDAGVIYVSDTDDQSVSTISPDGTVRPFLRDPRLLWVDAMWIDDDRQLWMPAAQLNRTSVFSEGRDRTTPPFHLYSAPVPDRRSQ